MSEHHEVFISLIPPFELSFEVDRDTLDRCLRESDLSNADFRKQSNIIEIRLLAILGRTEEHFIESRIERLELKDEKIEQEKEKLHKELESVRNALWNQHLQDRYDLKASSKAPWFTGIDWDTKLKTRDSKVESIHFPYATCRIAYQIEFGGSPLALLGGKNFDSMQMNFSIDEIEYLIRVFTSIRRYLEEMEREVKK